VEELVKEHFEELFKEILPIQFENMGKTITMG
jgi:hypothetical protein